MDSLEEFLVQRFPKYKAVLDEVEDGIQSSLNLFETIEFVRAPAGNAKAGALWPYWVLDKDRGQARMIGNLDARPGSRVSQSTNSMILVALLAGLFGPHRKASSGYFPAARSANPQQYLSRALERRIRNSIAALETQWLAEKETIGSDGKVNKNDKLNNCTLSGTFGKNDLLTLSWHLDIFSPTSPFRKHSTPNADVIYASILRTLGERISNFPDATSAYQGVVQAFNNNNDGSQRIVIGSAYNLLRLVRFFSHVPTSALRHTDASLAAARDRAFSLFRSRLHNQLSYNEIPDGRFDPAELVFCLEGLLQINREAIGETLIARVFDVIEKAPVGTTFWHTATPMTANHKGQVLYPSSVETATSLLNILSILDAPQFQIDDGVPGASKYLPLATKYWQWLKGRRASIVTQKGRRVDGWHSEHLNDSSIIHTWETSQILEFLVIFRDQLERYLARMALHHSGLTVEHPKPLRKPWSEIVAEFEPVSSLGRKYEVYKRVGEDFIEAHQSAEADKKFWSMLLYGPPGTGKTTFAKNMAAALQAPLITVTVSDFLAEGQARMEMRAKLIFEALAMQRFSIVLFDEMDQFILDRDSGRFREQDSVFQFLTPGMLTKFANLREAERVLFIIATNYEERIDSAIKRTGRIDESYLVLLPDSSRRHRILESFGSLNKIMKSRKLNLRERISEASAFLGYKDLEKIASGSITNADELIDELKRASRNLQFHSYSERFTRLTNGKLNLQQGAWEELVCVCMLACREWREGLVQGGSKDVFVSSMRDLERDSVGFSELAAELDNEGLNIRRLLGI